MIAININLDHGVVEKDPAKGLVLRVPGKRLLRASNSKPKQEQRTRRVSK
jgi:hypothetical protein